MITSSIAPPPPCGSKSGTNRTVTIMIQVKRVTPVISWTEPFAFVRGIPCLTTCLSPMSGLWGRAPSTSPSPTAPEAGTPAVEGGEALVFPGFIDAHTHIDKTLLGMPWRRHEVGPTLMDKIVNERELVKRLDLDSHERSMEQVRRSLANGTTAIRTFSDINTEWKLKGFHGLLKTREDVGGLMDLQIVTFPQSGMLIRPGTLALMDAAMAE